MIHPLDAFKIASTRKLSDEYRSRLENATGKDMALDMLRDAVCAGNKKIENRIRQSLLLNHDMKRVEVDVALALPRQIF